MSTRLTDEELRATVEARAKFNTDKETADFLGLKRSGVSSRLQDARNRGLLPPIKAAVAPPGIVFPDLPSSELPVEDLIDQAVTRFQQHQTAKDARKWMEIKIGSNDPIGICFMGDPHVDSPGCNWPLLRRHVNILKDTPGLYALNIGDQSDNWVGRLVRLYAEAEMSKRQARKIAKWLMRDAGINWLLFILGNHDLFGDGMPELIRANAKLVPVEDWQSRFQLVFPNGQRVRVHAAHDFPGSSIWNKMHGPQKASMLYDQADIFACGHKHEWAINESENANRDFVYNLIRARGYKYIDSYADQLGYASQKYGASITAIIDPRDSDVKRIRCFPDLDEAAEYLTWKRSR
jgi:hypothetical protein